jgi:hypothetical protein
MLTELSSVAQLVDYAAEKHSLCVAFSCYYIVKKNVKTIVNYPKIPFVLIGSDVG